MAAIATVGALGCGASAGSAGSVPPNAAVGDGDNGRTVTVTQGQLLVVTLGSTYWTFQGSSDSGVLRQVGTPSASAGSCPPGVGCGRATDTYQAVGRGQATVTASRTSCGEALSCTGGAGSYRIAVVVSGR